MSAPIRKNPPRKTLQDLAADVQQSGGVMTVSAGRLRDLYGAERLGINVRYAIGRELAGLGLAHYPADIPDRQDESVRVYKQGSPVAELIDAATTVGPDADRLLLKAANSDGDRIVAKIRELLE